MMPTVEGWRRFENEMVEDMARESGMTKADCAWAIGEIDRRAMARVNAGRFRIIPLPSDLRGRPQE